MEKKYLIINAGSASKKFAFFDNGRELISIHLENEGKNFVSNVEVSQKSQKVGITKKQFADGLNYALDLFLTRKIILNKDEISAVGIRVVAPGEYFQSNRLINNDFLIRLEKAKETAPLHISPLIENLNSILKTLPKTPIVGISDSSFHFGILDEAKLYSIAKKDAKNLGIYKYGYHGLSFKSVLSRLKKDYGELPKKIVMCHLGGGVSITAVKNGRSIDTSMGFTPLEGAVMATRIGDIDVGAVLYLLKKTNMNLEEAGVYFNNKCGLKGISGKSSDLRELLRLEKSGDVDAKMALSVFEYKIKKQIGAYSASLNGLDMLVFSGTIGERSSIMRERICKNLSYLGVSLDKQRNNKVNNASQVISSNGAKVKILVVKTEEMNQMAQEIRAFGL